jgi:hypothetical protein
MEIQPAKNNNEQLESKKFLKCFVYENHCGKDK